MPFFSPMVRFGMAVIGIAVSGLSAFAAEKPALVWLDDGSRIRSEIDPRTDVDRLWLTTQFGGGRVSQSIGWERVVQMELGGHSMEGWVARAAVATLREHEREEGADQPPSRPRLLALGPANGSDTAGHRERVPVRQESSWRVEAMDVTAWLSNWDQDVVDDGLLVELVPLDSKGYAVQCDGVLDFTLRAWRESEKGGGLTAVTERWSKAVRTADFESGGLLLRLPFRVVEPHRNSQWWVRGALEVRFTVPGSGVVQRTITDLRLRPFSPMRDRLEERTGVRYLSSENAGREAWSSP